MTRADDERTAADVRYAAARTAVEKLPVDADATERDDALAELREARRHVARHARRAGSVAKTSVPA